MKLGVVVGNVVATAKNEELTGKKILLIRELDGNGNPKGAPIAALDAAGVGPGEKVFFVTSKEASFPFEPLTVPADASVLGVVDRVNRKKM